MFTSHPSTRLWLTILLCGGLTVTVAGLASAKAPWSFRTQASDKKPTAQAEAVRSKLNHPIGLRWDKLINGLAAEHGMTAVIERIPSGNFKRFDRREYNLTDALNLLNVEDVWHQVFKGAVILAALGANWLLWQSRQVEAH